MPKDDLASLLRAFDAIPKAARKPIQAAIEKGADEMVNRMKYLVPEDQGDLKRSIKATITSDVSATVTAGDETTFVPLRADGGVEIQNAFLQEYGTKDMPRNPFFWPSVNTTKKRVRRRVDRAISKAVKEVWSR